MSDRYSRQMLFHKIGETGQEKIKRKHVLIIGVGALGTANAEILARSGVGKLTLVDRDYVELSNLQRQQLFSEEDVYDQLPKAVAAKRRLEKINSEIVVDAHVMDATIGDLETMMGTVDVVIDATDNYDIRFYMNDLIHKYDVPWIFGSCVGSSGMSYTILPGDTPCLSCILQATPVSGATCDSVGIISPAVQMVVVHQTTEALKLLVEDVASLRTRLVMFDLWNNYYQTIGVERAKEDHCATCGEKANYPYLTDEHGPKTEVLCGRNTVQIRTNKKFELQEMGQRLSKLGIVKGNEFLLSLEYKTYRLVLFRDGRTLVHGTNSIEEAKRVYYQLVG
ncbi:MoeB/ThiF family adenylyltransferase [Bacillaceae bacterium W0354]